MRVDVQLGGRNVTEDLAIDRGRNDSDVDGARSFFCVRATEQLD
jgi:hypothetical protein